MAGTYDWSTWCDGGAGGHSCPRIQQFSSATTPYNGIPAGSNGGPGTYGRVDAAGHINSVADTTSRFFKGQCVENGVGCKNHANCCSVYCNTFGLCQTTLDRPTTPLPPTTNPPPIPTLPTNPPPTSCTKNALGCNAPADCCSAYGNDRNVCRRAPDEPPSPTPATNPLPSPIPPTNPPPNPTPPIDAVGYPLSDSMSDCVHVAEQFRNTCTFPREIGSDYNFNTNIGGITPKTVTCPNWPRDRDFPCIGWMEGTLCIWHRCTCVTCYPDTDGKAMIHVQTNNMPDHCPGNSLVKPQELNYEVLFNSSIVVGGNHIDFLNQPTTRPKFVPGASYRT